MLLEMFRPWKVGEMTLQMSLYFKAANVFFSAQKIWNKTSSFAIFFFFFFFTLLKIYRLKRQQKKRHPIAFCTLGNIFSLKCGGAVSVCLTPGLRPAGSWNSASTLYVLLELCEMAALTAAGSCDRRAPTRMASHTQNKTRRRSVEAGRLSVLLSSNFLQKKKNT